MPKFPARAIVALTDRRRWRVDEARAVLAHLDSSGLSVRAFAARENLSPQRLHRWRAQLGAAGTRTPSFIEIKPAAMVIEVVLRCGVVVRVPEGFSEATLRRLVILLDEQDTRC